MFCSPRAAPLYAKQGRGAASHPRIESVAHVVLYAEAEDDRFERAAVRWLGRLMHERPMNLAVAAQSVELVAKLRRACGGMGGWCTRNTRPGLASLWREGSRGLRSRLSGSLTLSGGHCRTLGLPTVQAPAPERQASL